MTNNQEMNHGKDWKSNHKASQNKDEFLNDLVTILARGAAKRDFEEMLAQERSETLH